MRRRRYLRARPRARRRTLQRLMLLAALAVCACALMTTAERPDAEPAATQFAAVTQGVELEAYSFYAIQFGAFDNEADARALTQSYVSRGAAGYVLTDTRSRALGAAYRERADADAVCRNLAAQGIDSYVYEVSAPRVELRVTATPAQIAAIRAARDTAVSAIDSLSALALGLARGDTSSGEALRALNDTGAQADAARRGLEEALGGRTHAVTAGLISELHAISDSCGALAQQNLNSDIAFSGKIKYNIIDLMQRHVQFMQMLIQPAASA